MAAPLFKDTDKYALDIINEDYDVKNVLKVKVPGPFGIGLTTATEYKAASSTKSGKVELTPKLTTKWAYGKSGFTIDKFEIKGDGALTLETSLTGVAPGLKLEFKGDDALKGDLGVIYKTDLLHANAELDLVDFAKFKSSVTTKAGPVVAGLSASVEKSKDTTSFKTLDVALTYSLPSSLFIGLKTSKWFCFTDFSFAYDVAKAITVASAFTFCSEKKTITTFTLGGLYKCNPSTALKFKVNTKGLVNASVKQSIDKSASATLAAEVDVAKINAYKIGVSANLG